MKVILKRFEFLLFGFLLSGMMSLLVSGLSTVLAAGLSPGFSLAWLKAWLSSWCVAFPAVLVVTPLVRRILVHVVKPDSATG